MCITEGQYHAIGVVCVNYGRSTRHDTRADLRKVTLQQVAYLGVRVWVVPEGTTP